VRSLSSIEALGVADGPGGLVVTGAITTLANLGGPNLLPVGGYDQVVAAFDPNDGAHLYSTRHGDSGNEFGFLHNLDASGAPLIYGVTYGTVDLGQGQVQGGGGTGADGYIGRYGPSAPGWVARLVGPGEDKIIASAAGVGSTVYGAGWFEQTTSFNGGMLTSAGGRDLFLARFNTFTGDVDLTKTYGGAGRDEISTAASTGATLILAGMFDDTLVFGGTAQPITTIGALDVWVAKIDPDGAGVWAVRYGGAGDDRDPRVAVDAAGDIYLAGTFRGQVAFGAINLISSGGADIFIAKLHGGDGSVAWVKSIGSVGDDSVGDIAVDGAGHVALVGAVAGPIDGGTSLGGVDSLLASFDAQDGASRFRNVFSTAGDDRASAVTYGRNGDVYALIGLGGTFDFGMDVIGGNSYAAVLLRVAP
jgi:hypothetical protein